jgi:sRNA-binding regulator protein Hfq
MMAWKKILVSIHLINDSTLTGRLVIPRDSRLSDILNNSKKEFLVLTDETNQNYMLNKHHIIQVVEVTSTQQLDCN